VATLRRLPAGNLCPACYAMVLQNMRLWSVPFIIISGTVLMPVGWVLAIFDWARLGKIGRGSVLAGTSLVTRVLVAVAMAIFKPGFSVGVAALAFYALNAATMLIAVIGLGAPIAEQRAAGGRSGNWLIPIGAMLIPLFCFVAFYQVFSHVGTG
jgi:hypothetical protein